MESLSTINQNGDQEINKASCVAPGASPQSSFVSSAFYSLPSAFALASQDRQPNLGISSQQRAQSGCSNAEGRQRGGVLTISQVRETPLPRSWNAGVLQTPVKACHPESCRSWTTEGYKGYPLVVHRLREFCRLARESCRLRFATNQFARKLSQGVLQTPTPPIRINNSSNRLVCKTPA